MGEKDLTEKTLEAYNDVFADIVNVLLFKGDQVVRPEELEDLTPGAIYKADDKIRDIERDVAKKWTKNSIRIACIGLENQTKADQYMPLRVLGYDGVEYQRQLRDLKAGGKPCPVITLVLYFDYQKRWNSPTSLTEALEVPEILRPYVTDAKINLFEIAWLDKEQVNQFRSDFREVARYFTQMREDGEYRPSDDELQHIQSVLQLLNVMDRDHRFETAVNERKAGKEARTMSEWLTRVINESEAKGMAQGMAKGMEKGEIKTLAGLVRDGILTIGDAAKRANLSVAEFADKAGIPVQ